SIGFTATPEAIARAKKAALRKASADAEDQAEAVLETLQLTKNEIVKIKIDAANAARPRPYASEFDAAFSESRATTPIIAGEQTVRASVTLQISYTNDSSSNSQ
ncbi:MAG: SIMPL domain-containing protein, partial [Cyanobacteria bacterium J06635_13]